MVAILFTYLLSLVVFSCSSIDCPVQNTVSVQYEIRDKTGASLAITDSLSVISTRRDGKDILLNFTTRVDDQKIILNKLVDESAFSLPISYSHPEDVMVFQFNIANTDSLVKDTVWVKKEDHPHFESVDCNTTYFHTLTDVKCTRHYLDSIVLNNPSVTYDSQTVHFYLYPKSND